MPSIALAVFGSVMCLCITYIIRIYLTRPKVYPPGYDWNKVQADNLEKIRINAPYQVEMHKADIALKIREHEIDR